MPKSSWSSKEVGPSSRYAVVNIRIDPEFRIVDLAVLKGIRVTFKFRLSTVLKVREHERNVHRQAVAIARADYTQQSLERDRIAAVRAVILDELREINNGDGWQVDKVTHRQRHAEQLSRELELADAAVSQAAQHLERSLKSLVLSNQSVQVLEGLAERQLAEFEDVQTKVQAREYDDYLNSSRRIA